MPSLSPAKNTEKPVNTGLSPCHRENDPARGGQSKAEIGKAESSMDDRAFISFVCFCENPLGPWPPLPAFHFLFFFRDSGTVSAPFWRFRLCGFRCFQG